LKDRREAILGLLLRLRAMGLPHRLMSAFEAVPRQNFAPVMHLNDSYGRGQLPIECGQNMTSPDLMARMLMLLNVDEGHRVLELGTGTGYQTALLAKMAGKVISLERWHTLADKARTRLTALDIDNAQVELVDGRHGKPGDLFDRIISNCAYSDFPRHFVDQLTTNGIALAPIGPPDGEQILVKFTKIGSRFEAMNMFPVRMQPFCEGVARAI
jgi:protein-L-isoaspartate(D-aspartate) O-methyltransferase